MHCHFHWNCPQNLPVNFQNKYIGTAGSGVEGMIRKKRRENQEEIMRQQKKKKPRTKPTKNTKRTNRAPKTKARKTPRKTNSANDGKK